MSSTHVMDARRLAAAVDEDAVVILPEAVLDETPPDGSFFDVQDELGLALLELDDFGLDDAGDRVAAGAHAGAVDRVAGVDDRDLADHGPAAVGEDVQLFAQGVHRHLEVLDDRVGLALVVEGLLALRALDGVLGHVVNLSDAGALAGVDQFLALGGDQHRLHKPLGLPVVEQAALLRIAAHCNEARFDVELDVAQ